MVSSLYQLVNAGVREAPNITNGIQAAVKFTLPAWLSAASILSVLI